MDYVFLTPVHFLNINTQLNNGKKVINDLNIRISNNIELKNNLKNNLDYIKHLGYQSLYEIDDSKAYIYSKGNFEELMNKYSGFSHPDFAFLFLRISSFYLRELWSIIDNSAYVRDGFFYTVDKKPNCIDNIYKASLSHVYSKSNGKIEITTVSEDNIITCKNLLLETSTIDKYKSNTYLKYPEANPFGKELNRISRAESFITIARSNSVIALKIYNYCTALECLLNTDANEITHKISERVALLLGDTINERIGIFKKMKDAYSIRSKSTHGKPINKTDDELIELSVFLDNMLRRFFNKFKNDYPSSLSDAILNEYFTELLFNTEAEFPNN